MYKGSLDSLLCCPVSVPQMLLGGLYPVGLTATAVSPVVEQVPVGLGGFVRTRLSKSRLLRGLNGWH